MFVDPFHFTRTDLVDVFLSAFASGITSSKTLFAPRRMGKTEFITQDLAPAAKGQGYKVIYCNFWGNENNPALALLSALSIANKSENLWGRTKRLGRSSVNSIEVSGQMAGVKAGLKATLHETKISEDQLQQLLMGIHELLDQNEKILFLLDEVQHLATKIEFSPLVSLLRTVFEGNQHKLKVVYTGSSREGLQRLFKRRKSAMFKSSSQIDLPLLDRNFIRHELAAYKKATGRELSESVAINTFQKLHSIPRDFRELLEVCMTQVIEPDDFKTLAADFCNSMLQDDGYAHTWEELKPIDKHILALFASDSTIALYSEETKQQLADAIGVDDMPNHTIQNAVNRLREKGVLVQLERGMVEFEDAHFKDWCNLESTSK